MVQVLRGGVALAALLAWAVGSAGVTAAQPRPSTKSPAASSAPMPNAIKQPDQELDSIRAEQRKSSETEQRLATENDAISDDRRKLNQSLISAASRIRATEERVAAMEIHVRQLESSEADIRRSLDERHALIADILAALQRIGHRPPPAVFVGAADAIESLRTAMSLEAVLPQIRNETNKLQVELASLTRVKIAKTAEHTELAAQLAELATMQKKMATLVEERQTRQSEIEQAITAERQRAATLSRQVDNLKDLIGKLEPGGDSTKRTTRAPTKSGLSALNDPARMGPAIAFVSAKGRLSLPVSGARIREFGAPDGAGGTEKGTSVATRPGAQVTAPSDGWVVYAAPYRSYGQLLILNVGGGYHVLLAGMERITVDPGQFVLTGEPVAVMGSGTRVASVSTAGSSSAIGSPQPVLYIEFRKDGTPVDSSPWWAAT
ncbi:MAG TPA: peptidoglycan DD-metalloendopeptidase family protein, partial [Xanthobacteraceae bacterium]|nr:peptidoglycan DD-metalloendopeptidase family protein [Xanthobacteraceae bacterium]